MALIEHESFFSHYEAHNGDMLIVGLSGSGISRANRDRPTPISWQAGLFRSQKLSFLTLSTKARHFWPSACIDEVRSRYAKEIAEYSRVLLVGVSMGGWGALTYAHRFGARQVLAVSPRNPNTAKHAPDQRFGPVAPLIWPTNAAVTILSDKHDHVEKAELEGLRATGPLRHVHTQGTGHSNVHLLNMSTTGPALLWHWINDELDQNAFDKLTVG